MSSGGEGLVWTWYDGRGTRSRVREYLVIGESELELCAEGGLLVIRRTIRQRRKRPIVLEAARGPARDTEEAWTALVVNLRMGRPLQTSHMVLRALQKR